MSDPKPTIYEADPHTQAKHRILKAYLERWLPILDKQAQLVKRGKQRLLYVDGFAGAGEYENSAPGSPLIPIETALGHSGRPHSAPRQSVFNLRGWVEPHCARIARAMGLFALAPESAKPS